MEQIETEQKWVKGILILTLLTSIAFMSAIVLGADINIIKEFKSLTILLFFQFLLTYSFLYFITSLPRQIINRFNSFKGNRNLLLASLGLLLLFLMQLPFFFLFCDELVWMQVLNSGNESGGWTSYPPLSALPEAEIIYERTFPSLFLIRSCIILMICFLATLIVFLGYKTERYLRLERKSDS